MQIISYSLFYVFFFNDTATTEIYTLSLHDALPIYGFDAGDEIAGLLVAARMGLVRRADAADWIAAQSHDVAQDRKSTRLNSSHANISYAVFCLKKKKKNLRSTPLSHPAPTIPQRTT